MARLGKSMNALYLFRHAKAEPKNLDGDRDRVLAERGRADAKAMAAIVVSASNMIYKLANAVERILKG